MLHLKGLMDNLKLTNTPQEGDTYLSWNIFQKKTRKFPVGINILSFKRNWREDQEQKTYPDRIDHQKGRKGAGKA